MADTPAGNDVLIVRDNTFCRATADNAVLIPLGRDFEIAFLAFSPQPLANRIGPDADPDSPFAAIHIENRLVEVARLRMAPESAQALAMQITQRAVEGGLSLDVFTQNVRDLIAKNVKSDSANAEA